MNSIPRCWRCGESADARQHQVGLIWFTHAFEEHMPQPEEEVPERIKEARDRLGVGADHRNANERQVSGSHYGLDQFQHWDVVVKFDLDYFQGQITKYVMRWDKKNGLQDLEKAQHFLEKYIEEVKAGRIFKRPPRTGE